jgi:hypothetical protein
MRTSMAYLAGVGTVVAAVTVGLGGGLIISNIVSPHEPRTEMSKLEQRMSSRPIAVMNTASDPIAPARNEPQTQPAASVPTDMQATQAATGVPPAASPQPTAATVTPAATSEKINSEQIKTPEAAFARARDSDVKPRDVDVRREARRAAEEKRKAERRQQWAERRRPRQDQELRDVEAKVREETEQPRAFAAEPVRFEMRRIRLFEAE